MRDETMSHQETVTVRITEDSSVNIQATVVYKGTRIIGSKNVEDSEVTFGSWTLPGTWDGDARHNTSVLVPENHPEYAAIVEYLRPRMEAQEQSRARKDLEEQQAYERKFYGRVLTY
jgi:hypothetical protein